MTAGSIFWLDRRKNVTRAAIETCNTQKRDISVMMPILVCPRPLKKASLFQAFMSASECDVITGTVYPEGVVTLWRTGKPDCKFMCRQAACM